MSRCSFPSLYSTLQLLLVQVTLEARQMLIVQQGMSIQQKIASIESLLRAVATGARRDLLQHSSVSSPSDAGSDPSECRPPGHALVAGHFP